MLTTCHSFRRWVIALSLGSALSAVSADEESGYTEPALSGRDARFWAFQAPRRPEIPPGLAENPIDALLLERLREAGIPDFAPQAAPETLLRRLCHDLTGLPPTPGEMTAFLAAHARSPEKAWREKVDALLDSPRHGERWAQHWLDAARWAETDGFEHDKVRREAWRYRDWVIRALNEDLPMERFIALQIAGDELEPESPEAGVATGFLLAGPDMPDINLEEERRHQLLNELTGTVGAVFLGLTLECAQCHDHRTDPLSQADFYRLRAVFEDFSLPAKNQSVPVVYPSRTPAAESRLFLRGDFRRPGPAVAADVPRVLNLKDSGRVGDRAALARWLTRADHPLTGRVMVNRIWQQHFGVPLVGTPSDFGKLGDRPTHPELLDWLTTELGNRSGSFKAIHREILHSRAWRQASRAETDDARGDWSRRLELDPENRLYSRQHRRRLEGEAIRDTMLSVAGGLNLKMGGPGVRPELPPEVTATLLKDQWPVTADVTEHDRRSIYLFARRNLRFPFFEVFDRPDANQSCARRPVSTTAPQALTLWNDAFVRRMAAATGERLGAMPGSERVPHAYRLLLGREATAEEVSLGEEFLASQPLETFVLALFNLNEFVYLD